MRTSALPALVLPSSNHQGGVIAVATESIDERVFTVEIARCGPKWQKSFIRANGRRCLTPLQRETAHISAQSAGSSHRFAGHALRRADRNAGERRTECRFKGK